MDETIVQLLCYSTENQPHSFGRSWLIPRTKIRMTVNHFVVEMASFEKYTFELHSHWCCGKR